VAAFAEVVEVRLDEPGDARDVEVPLVPGAKEIACG
jgi:hypothetical protein